MSIYIGLLGLAAFGIVVQLLVRKWRSRSQDSARRRISALLLPAISVLVLLVGAWDQTNDQIVPDYETVRADFLEDQSYVEGLESAVPQDSMIYQLPYQPFPEGPYLVNQMVDYDHLRLSLHSDSLRWSYGGPKGRPSTDWPSLLTTMSTEDMVARVAAAGFEGISVDRLGYADRGAALEQDLASILHVRPLESDRGTYSFWDIAQYRQHLIDTSSLSAVDELGYATTHPVLAYGVWPGLTVVPSTDPASGQTWQSTDANTQIEFATNSSSSTRVRVSFFIGQAYGLTSVSVVLPDGTKVPIRYDPAGFPVTFDLTVKPGASYLRIETESAEGAPNYLVQNLYISSD